MEQQTQKHKQKPGVVLSAPAKLLLALFTLLFCAAVLVLGMIRPYEKIKTYLNIAFMDDLGGLPLDSLSGLEIVEHEIDTAYSGESSETGTAIIPAFGEQYAVLECEAIGLKAPVYWGSNAALLEKGAVQTTNSAVIGSGGNAVIDAHVNTFFRDLNQLQKGDTVVVYTSYGRFTYTVSKTITFKNTEKKYVMPTDQEQLTLYTCEMQVLGASDVRIGAVCDCVKAEYYQKDAVKEAEQE